MSYRAFVPSVVVVTMLVSSHASGQDLEIRALGVRGGIGSNPDQFHIGAYLHAGYLARHVRFQPGFEMGIGNGVRLGAVNADVLYVFSSPSWRPYVGGGPGLNFVDVTDGVGESRGLELEPVLNLVGGIEWGAIPKGSRAPHRYLLEARVGLGETSDLKLSAGFTF